MLDVDFLIVGAGIAGASTAYQLRHAGSTLIIDMEATAGYHTTGRSAAFYAETYGGPLIQPLTTASKEFFLRQPPGFSETQILTKLGAIHTFGSDQREEAEQVFTSQKKVLPAVEMLSAQDVVDRVPLLDVARIAGGIYDPDCGNLDVSALHQGYLKHAKQAGVRLMLDAGLESAQFMGGRWQVQTRKGAVSARVLINASGAWGDYVAKVSGVRPLGLKPLRRTIITVPSPEEKAFNPDAPVVLNFDETCYFKPEGDGYLVSPADEILSDPCDAQPDMEDIAIAAHQFGQETGTEVKVIRSKWAGLRTFAPDRLPVIGFDAEHPAYFWNVGQGGYGIQTAPAWSSLVASLLLGEPLSGDVSLALSAAGVGPQSYSPRRFGA